MLPVRFVLSALLAVGLAGCTATSSEPLEPLGLHEAWDLMEPYRQEMGNDTIVYIVNGREPTPAWVNEPARSDIDEASRREVDNDRGDGRAWTWIFLLANDREAHEIVVGHEGVIAWADIGASNPGFFVDQAIERPSVGFDGFRAAAGDDWDPQGNVTMIVMPLNGDTIMAVRDDDEQWVFSKHGEYLGQDDLPYVPGTTEVTGVSWRADAPTRTQEHQWELAGNHPFMTIHFELYAGFFDVSTSGWQITVTAPDGEQRDYVLDAIDGPETLTDHWEPAPAGTWHATGMWTKPGATSGGVYWSACTDGNYGMLVPACDHRP